jgi:hypothetical protein
MYNAKCINSSSCSDAMQSLAALCGVQEACNRADSRQAHTKCFESLLQIALKLHASLSQVSGFRCSHDHF